MNCTVQMKPDGGCEIWLGTQVIARVQQTAAKLLGVSDDKVIVHNHLLGGGFGRRLEPDMALKAIRVAQKLNGEPVKVVWSREEDMQHDVYRPVYRDEISATVNDGKIAGWKYKISGSSVIARWLPPAFQKGIDIDAVDCGRRSAVRNSESRRALRARRTAGGDDRFLARRGSEQQRVRDRMLHRRTGEETQQGSDRIPQVDARQRSALQGGARSGRAEIRLGHSRSASVRAAACACSRHSRVSSRR